MSKLHFGIIAFSFFYILTKMSFASTAEHAEHTEPTEHVEHVEKTSEHKDTGHNENHNPVEQVAEHTDHSEHAEAVAEHSNHAEHGKEETKKDSGPSFWTRLFYPVKVLWTSIDEKLAHLQKLDEENKELKMKVVKYEIELAKFKHEKLNEEENKKASHIKLAAKEEGGKESSRQIASLEVADETILSLPPKKIYEKAVQAFSARDYETSAKAFVQLSDTEDNEAYHTAQVAIFAGISLYHVGNYKQASKYLERSLKLMKTRAPASAEGESESELAPQAMAWLSLCRAQVGDTNGARHIVQGLIQQYPKSREARRLNRNEGF